MNNNCGKACAVDKGGTNCPAWTKAGECGKNPAYMYKKCAKSCCGMGGPEHVAAEQIGAEVEALDHTFAVRLSVCASLSSYL
jgi:hypothetical protein